MSVPVMAAVGACALLLAVPVLVTSQSVADAARASLAADAAALASADVMLGMADAGGMSACEFAAEIASLNGAHLEECVIEENRGEARVSVTVQTGLLAVTRAARAGPLGAS